MVTGAEIQEGKIHLWFGLFLLLPFVASVIGAVVGNIQQGPMKKSQFFWPNDHKGPRELESTRNITERK